MQPVLEDIEKQALKLSKEDRGLLAEKLLGTLNDDSLNEIDVAWINEAEKRYNEYLKGKKNGIPGEKFFSTIREDLGWQD